MFKKSCQTFLPHCPNFRRLMTKNVISFGSRTPKPVSMAYMAFEGTDAASNAPPLIVIHELFATKIQWKNICRAIQEKTKPRRKVIAVDVRNHGNSPHSPYHSYPHLAEDIINLLKENDIDRAALLGHGVGGRAAMYTALKYPKMVERLIAVDISPVSTSRTLLQLENVFSNIKSLIIAPHLSLSDGRDSAKRHLGNFLRNQTMLEFLVDNVRKTESGRFVWGQNVNALHSNFKNMAHFPLEDILAYQYREPSLFIAGSKSDFLKLTEFDGVKRFFPKADIQFLDSGHEIHVEYPSELAKTVISFINQ